MVKHGGMITTNRPQGTTEAPKIKQNHEIPGFTMTISRGKSLCNEEPCSFPQEMNPH
jgi:hypothetical protein